MNKKISDRVLIVAELSANHNQNRSIAIDTIKAAKRAGADAIKLQTYTADTMTIDSEKDWFRIKGGTLWDGKTLYNLYNEAYTPWEWHKELFSVAKEEGLVCFSTPFDVSAVDFLEDLGNPIYKIASFEITDTPLISYIAKKGKPIILSTGIAALEDIELAIETCKAEGNEDITILKCTSSYPAPLSEANLATIPEMRKRFGLKVGLSDHTIGSVAATTAVALGASVIEKHFIIDRSLGGPDSAFSMEPDEFLKMTMRIRDVESALGNSTFDLSDASRRGRKFSRSLFAVEDIKEGDLFTASNIRSIRPGDGMHPKFIGLVLGKKAATDIERGTPLQQNMIN